MIDRINKLKVTHTDSIGVFEHMINARKEVIMI